MVYGVILLIVIAGLAYVRLAPTDVVRWHAAAEPGPVGEKVLKGGYIWRALVGTGDGAAMLRAIDSAAMATPRTKVLSGSMETEQITYVTRSRLFGFPDYTTVGLYDAADGQRMIEAYGRLRFGSSDLGVNAKRVKGWVAALKL